MVSIQLGLNCFSASYNHSQFLQFLGCHHTIAVQSSFPYQKQLFSIHRFSAVVPHAFLQSSIARGVEIRMKAPLQRAKSSYLWDHQVLHQSLFPAAAMIEGITGVLQSICKVKGTMASYDLAAMNVNIIAPLVLPSAQEYLFEHQEVVLEYILDTKAGTVELAVPKRSDHILTKGVHLRALPTRLMIDSKGSIRPRNYVFGNENMFDIIKDFQGSVMLDKVAMANVQSNAQAGQCEQYCVNPAIMDNCTQVGAALKDSNENKSQPLTRVPTSVSAYVTNGQVKELHTFAVASLTDISRNQAISCDFGLCLSSSQAIGFKLSAMQFKPLRQDVPRQRRNNSESHPQNAANEFFAAHEHIYGTLWAASEPKTSSKPSNTRPIEWQATLSDGLRKVFLYNDKKDAMVTSMTKSLRFIQSVVNEDSNDMKDKQYGVILRSNGRSPDDIDRCDGMETTNASTSFLIDGSIALLRVAAQENPSISWGHLSHDAKDEIRLSISPDMFGLSQRQGQVLQPELHPIEALVDNKILQDNDGLKGSVMITGGLGHIGMLCGIWVLESSRVKSLHLVGRSGHANRLPHALAETNAILNVAQCDATRNGEALPFMDSIRAHWPPLDSIMHASGVLQDALLQHQV